MANHKSISFGATTRQCPLCLCVYPLTAEYWHRTKATSYGFKGTCKPCWKAAYLATAPERAVRQAQRPKPTTRYCHTCEQLLPLTAEHWNSQRRTSAACCKSCIREQNRRRNAASRAKLPKTSRPTRPHQPPLQKVCPICETAFVTMASVDLTFCSGACWRVHLKQQSVVIRQRNERPCRWCGQVYLPHDVKYGKGFCCRDCHHEYRRAEKPRPVCVHCGTIFAVNKLRLPTARFCSRRCMLLYRGPSGLEILAGRTLATLGVPYAVQVQIDAFFADFVLYERYVVEIDGKYWHELKKEQDRFRDRIMRQRGFTVFRIPEDALLADPEGAIRAVLRQIPL